MDLVGFLAIVVALVAVPLSGLLAITDTVLTQTTRARAAALADEGRRPAAVLEELLARREEVLHPVLLLELGCDVGAAGIIAVAAYRLGGWVALVAAFVVGVPVMFLVAVALPRTWALHNLDRSIGIAAPLARAVSRPWLLRVLAIGALTVARRRFPDDHRPDILALGDESFLAVVGSPIEVDELPERANPLLAAVVDFGETIVREIMVPRPDMVTLPADASVGDAVAIVRREGYSRFPVTGDDVDSIVGTVYAKDLVNVALEGQTALRLEAIAHPPRFVPETKAASSLLREMQQEKLHLAIVVDEYGGIAGLVTLEDIIEELVGDIADEYDEDQPPIVALPDGRLRVDAALAVDEANERLGLQLPEGDWDTLGGLVFDHFGHVPAVGDVADIGGTRIEVDRVVGRRIKTVVLDGLRPTGTPNSEATAV